MMVHGMARARDNGDAGVCRVYASGPVRNAGWHPMEPHVW